MARKKKPTQPEVIETIEARYNFTDKEIITLSQQAASTHTEIGRLKEEAKNSAAEWKNRIKIAECKHNDLSNKIGAGYEMRPTECRVEFNAKQGRKTYVCRKTGEAVDERDMTPRDYELQLPFKDSKALNPVAEAYDKAVEQAEEKFSE